MKRYRAMAIIDVTKLIGYFDAETEAEAIEKAWASDECFAPGLCYACSSRHDYGDVVDVIAREAEPGEEEDEVSTP